MEREIDLAQKALRYLEVAEKFEESKEWHKALENYEIAFEDLRKSGYLAERIDELSSRINEIKKIIDQGEKFLQEEEDSKRILEMRAYSLIDGANKLESEGNYHDAVENSVFAISLLIQAGWNEQQLEHLKSKAIKLAEVIDQQELTNQKKHVSIPQESSLPGSPLLDVQSSYEEKVSNVNIYKEKKKTTQEIQEKAFDILDKANELEREKNFDEAIKHYQESIELLNSIGWVEQTRNIETIIDKIRKNVKEMEKFQGQKVEMKIHHIIQEPISQSQNTDANVIIKVREVAEKKKEEEKIQERAFYLIDEAKRLEREKKYDHAIKQLENAINLFEKIEWDSHIQLIFNYIGMIRNKQNIDVGETQKLKKKQQELMKLQEAISSKQKEKPITSSEIREARQREYQERIAEKKTLEEQFYNLLTEADHFLQNSGDYDSAIDKYNQALELANVLGPNWRTQASTIKTTLMSVERIKKVRTEEEIKRKQKIEENRKKEVEAQLEIARQSTIEREKLKQKHITLLYREEEKKTQEMKRDDAFKILDSAQEYIIKGDLEKAISAYHNAAKIFVEIQWLDEVPLIETAIKKLELKIKQRNLIKQEKLNKKISILEEEKEFYKQIARGLENEKSKQRQKETVLIKKKEYQQYVEMRKQEAFKILEDSELEIRKGQYSKAIEMYRNAELILNEIQYPITVIEEMIQRTESIKQKQEKLDQKEKERKLQVEKEESDFQVQIAKENAKERERLRRRQIIQQKREESILQLEKQKENAFKLLEDADNLLRIRKYDESLDKYRKAEIILHQLQFPTESIKATMVKIIHLKNQEEIEKEQALQKKLELLQEERELEAIIEERQLQEREKKIAELLALEERREIAREQANYREIAFSLLERAKPYLEKRPPEYDPAISLYAQAKTILEDNVGWEPEIKKISELIQDLQREKFEQAKNQKMEEKERIKRQLEYDAFQEEICQRRSFYEKESENQKLKYEEMLERKYVINELRDEGLKLIDQAKRLASTYEFDKAYNLYEEAKKKFKKIGWDEEIGYIEAEIKNTRRLQQNIEHKFKEIQAQQRELEQKRKYEEELRRKDEEKKKDIIDEIGSYTSEITTILGEKQKIQSLTEKKEKERIAQEAKMFRKNMSAMINFKKDLTNELVRAKDEEKKRQEEKQMTKELKELKDISEMIKKVAKKDD